jgi:hypothetical protein
MRSSVVALFLALLGASILLEPVAAQTGTPPFSTFSGGPDLINLANLNAHDQIPILARPGRGIPFAYSIAADSTIVARVPLLGSGYGWGLSWSVAMGIPASIGVLRYSTAPAYCGLLFENMTRYSNFVYTDPGGTAWTFGGVAYQLSADTGSCDANHPATITGRSPFGASLFFGVLSASVHDLSGRRLISSSVA